MTDALSIAQDLIRCPSVTPADAGALGVLEKILTAAGFACHRVTFSEPGTADVDNLYARIGTEGPHITFAGHTDVVPPGDESAWSVGASGSRAATPLGGGASLARPASASAFATHHCTPRQKSAEPSAGVTMYSGPSRSAAGVVA